MPTAEELADWDRQHHWHAFSQMAQYQSLVIERAEGVWLYDTQGRRRFLDGVSSMWCNLLGHSTSADKRCRSPSNSSAWPTTRRWEWATRPPRRWPSGWPTSRRAIFNTSSFASDGSSAIEAALKMAFQYWRQCDSPSAGKDQVSRPGRSVSWRHPRQRQRGRHRPLPRAVCTAVVRSDSRAVTRPIAKTQNFILDQLEQTLADRHEEIAAMVLEPLVQGRRGDRVSSTRLPGRSARIDTAVRRTAGDR